jgi:hypothetical protein
MTYNQNEGGAMPYVYAALTSLRPGAAWKISDGILEWLDTVQIQPTDAEMTAEITRLQAEYDAQEYARSRKAEYDALNQLELMSDDAINGTTTHKDAIVAIKTKYPKV